MAEILLPDVYPKLPELPPRLHLSKKQTNPYQIKSKKYIWLIKNKEGTILETCLNQCTALDRLSKIRKEQVDWEKSIYIERYSLKES